MKTVGGSQNSTTLFWEGSQKYRDRISTDFVVPPAII